MIAFLGMGLLGSNFVQALRKRGEAVQVWNRSPARATALDAIGARPFATAADAVRGATRVHLTLKDDAAVDEVLEAARGGLAAGTVIVDHSTTSAAGTLARIVRWRDRGMTYVHAPVFMGPQNARESTGVMMISGPRSVVDPLREPLAAMTGKLVDLGERPDAGAAFKLLGNSFLMALTAGIADVLTLAKIHGVTSDQAATLFEFFNPAGVIAPRMKRMAEAAFSEPSWELAMARKDAGLMLDAAAAAHTSLIVTPAVAARMDAAIAAGHGADDWTVIAVDPKR